MNRRNFIVGAGSIGAATIGGAAVLSGSAAAELSGTMEFDEVDTVQVDDGTYQYVTTASASVFEWQGFENPATAVSVTAEVRLPGENVPEEGDWHELHSTTMPLADIASGDRGGTLDWSTGEGYNGVLHTGAGDKEPILGDHADQLDRDHDLTDAWDALEPQSADARWPVLVSEDYENKDDLYGLITPLETNAPEVTGDENDGESKETEVEQRSTVVVHDANYDSSSHDPEDYGSAAETVLQGSFYMTIENIASGQDHTSEGDATVHADSEKMA